MWDTGPVPAAANLNFVAGQTVPNSVTVKLNTDGTVRLGNTNGAFSGPSVHVVIDVIGWYDDGVVNTSGGTPYQPVAPERILDTRFGRRAVPDVPADRGCPWPAERHRDRRGR